MKRIYIVVSLFIIFVASFAIAENLYDPSLKIENVKVATVSSARLIAIKQYIKKMNRPILATEAPREFSIITLGFDMSSFGKKGDKVWEARVLTIENELRAILWIHSETEKVYFVIGHWEENSKER